MINPDVPGDITITPLAGWDFGQPGPIVIPREDAIRPEGFNPTSDLGEAEGHFCTLEVHTNDVHIGKMDATVVAEDVIAMYAVPDRYAIVSDAASYEGDIDGTHLQTATYSGCAICGQPEDSETRYVAWIDIDWTASASGITTNSAVWTGPMAKGGHTVHFSMHAECQACGASTGGTAAGGATVYELSIDLPDEYLGLNLTDAMKGKYVTRTATAKVDPAPPKVEYAWSDCGRCEWRSATTRENVTYGATDKTGPSSSYRAEPLTVGATVTKGDLSASANCTTNFTVVKVDVKLEGTTEQNEELKRPEVYYIADEKDGGLSRTGFGELKPVRISCEPSGLPPDNAVSLQISSGARLYEITGDDQASLVTKPYACREIGRKKFGIHGHDVSVLTDLGEVLYARSDISKATDSCRVRVVQPPPLKISDVRLLSPAVDGKWPYDPIWDNPDYESTVDGSVSKWCAEYPGEAKVKYALNRAAGKIEGRIYKNCGMFSRDTEIELLNDMSSVNGAHVSKWSLTEGLDTGAYYVEVTATEGETGKEISVKSNKGEVVRGDYCTSDAHEVEEAALAMTITNEIVDKEGLRQTLIVTFVASVPLAFIPGAPEITAGTVLKSVGTSLAVLGVTYPFTKLPNWFVPEAIAKKCEWHVEHWVWKGAKYEVMKNISIPVDADPDFGMVTVNRKGKFIIGYECFMAPKTFMDDNGKPYSKLVPCEEGYYTDEDTQEGITGSNADAPKYFSLQKSWAWSERPYGFVKPVVNVE